MTGGTGFVGARLIQQALDAGHELRALTRRPQAARPGLHWIEGALDDSASLAVLVEGADAVIHVAGVVNAPDRAGFAAGNIAGTEAMLAATEAAGIRRFVHVSSLAAREPDLSTYGWSKAEAEARALRGVIQSEFADDIIPHLCADGGLTRPARPCAAPRARERATKNGALVALVELITVDRVVEEVGEIGEQIQPRADRIGVEMGRAVRIPARQIEGQAGA
eukprot:gene9028-12205_t